MNVLASKIINVKDTEKSFITSALGTFAKKVNFYFWFYCNNNFNIV